MVVICLLQEGRKAPTEDPQAILFQGKKGILIVDIEVVETSMDGLPEADATARQARSLSSFRGNPVACKTVFSLIF